MLQRLELVNRLSELLPLECVGYRGVECPLSNTDHLSTDTDPTLVQETSCILVTMTELTTDIALGNSHVIKVDLAGTGGTDTEFVLGFGYRQSRCVTLDEEGRDAPVTLARVGVREDEEDTGDVGV